MFADMRGPSRGTSNIGMQMQFARHHRFTYYKCFWLGTALPFSVSTVAFEATWAKLVRKSDFLIAAA